MERDSDATRGSPDAAVDRPLLIYDGECGFCARWVRRLRRVTAGRVDDAPFQRVAGQFPQITPQQCARAVQLIEPDGRVSGGAEAVFRTLACRAGCAWLAWVYRRVPGAARISEGVYHVVARHRS